MLPLFRIIALMLLSAVSARAADYYVAPTGQDDGPGTLAQPWRTVQKAAETLRPGDTAFVRAGVYAPVVVRVSGTKGKWITFKNYPGETPVIDGTDYDGGSEEDSALVLITNRQYVRVQGFEVRNYHDDSVDAVPAGVFLRGACRFVEIRDCRIHDISNNGGSVAESGNAFGIAVYGSSAVPATYITIAGNELYNLRTGSSEALAINGNVTFCEVSGNTVHDCNNIGIVFIGYEETAPRPALDRARLSWCRGNLVYNISSQNNQAYTDGDFSAGGIYCDGAASVVVEQNTVHHCDIGVELASEHAGRWTSRIQLRNNFIYQNRQTGLAMGGYDEFGTGGTENCQIVANTFFQNDTLGWGNGEVLLRHRTRGCAIRQNIFFVGETHLAISAPVPIAQLRGLALADNLYWDAEGASAVRWLLDEDEFTGLSAWQTRTRQDRFSLVRDPLLISTSGVIDLHLSAASPARDVLPARAAVYAGRVDIDGDRRPLNLRVDLGADEWLAPAAP